MISKTSFIGYLFKSYFQAIKEAQAKTARTIKVAVVYTSQEDAEEFQQELAICLNNGVTAVAKDSITFSVEWFFTDSTPEFKEEDFDVLLRFCKLCNNNTARTVKVISHIVPTVGSPERPSTYFYGQWDNVNANNFDILIETDSDITLLGTKFLDALASGSI